MSGTFSDRYNRLSSQTETTHMHKLPFPNETSSTHKTKSHCNWFSSQTGIYNSKHTSIQLPLNPFLDVVTFIFSHQHTGHTALVDSPSGFSISYTQLHSMVKSMASGLHEICIQKQNVVLILLPNTIYYPVVLLSVLSTGAVVTTLNPLSSTAEIKKRVTDCNVVLVFTQSRHITKLEKMGVRAVAVPDYCGGFNLNSVEFSCFNWLLSSKCDYDLKPVVGQQDTAALLFSSGTSGASKGVVITHGNMIAMVELFVRFEASQYKYLASENIYLGIVPMFHVYGLSLLATGLFSLGSTVVVMNRFDAMEMVRAIGRYRITHLPLAPPALVALLRVKGGVDDAVFGCLKQVSCGAAPTSEKIIREFVQSFPLVDFIQGYGMTETTAVGTRGFNTEKIRKHTSVGLLAPNMQAKVVDWSTNSCLPPGQCGELWLHGPGIMKGYLNDPVATSSTIDKDGWLHTGDIVHFDEDGYLHVLDRLKEIIKYKGFQVAPADLEAVIISHPEILDVAVTSAIDEEAGEIPVAFVVKRPGSALSSANVMDFVAGQVSPSKKVRKVVFTHSIPKSASGKILRRQLRNYGTSNL